MELQKKVGYFLNDFDKRWNAANRKSDRFLTKNHDWINSHINFSSTATAKTVGRHSKSFEECGDSAKRLKTQGLRDENPLPKLAYATQMKFRAAGRIDEANVLKEITNSPSKANKCRKALKKDSRRHQKTIRRQSIINFCGS